MRLFKANQTALSEEDRARDLRLTSIASRYRTRPECAEENAALIADVFAALERERPAGLHYEALRGTDGVTFTHVVAVDEGVPPQPLMQVEAFRRFLAGIRERCVEPPQPVESTVLGRY